MSESIYSNRFYKWYFKQGSCEEKDIEYCDRRYQGGYISLFFKYNDSNLSSAHKKGVKDFLKLANLWWWMPSRIKLTIEYVNYHFVSERIENARIRKIRNEVTKISKELIKDNFKPEPTDITRISGKVKKPPLPPPVYIQNIGRDFDLKKFIELNNGSDRITVTLFFEWVFKRKRLYFPSWFPIDKKLRDLALREYDSVPSKEFEVFYYYENMPLKKRDSSFLSIARAKGLIILRVGSNGSYNWIKLNSESFDLIIRMRPNSNTKYNRWSQDYLKRFNSYAIKQINDETSSIYQIEGDWSKGVIREYRRAFISLISFMGSGWGLPKQM